MNLLRQGGHYLVFGVMQLVLDWAVFVTCTALGLPVASANLAGRTSGALLGFWLNGRYTFASEQRPSPGWRHFTRFGTVWIVMTVVSTVLVAGIESRLGLHWAWLAKPMVECGLSVVNFFLLRHLVYR